MIPVEQIEVGKKIKGSKEISRIGGGSKRGKLFKNQTSLNPKMGRPVWEEMISI